MDVFQAFPQAIEQWEMAPCEYSTITGNTIVGGQSAFSIHVIVDEGANSDPNPSPNAQGIYSDTLIYCRPEEMPTLDTAELVASWVVGGPEGESFKSYAIVDAGIGKNQHTGKIEHVELKLKQIGWKLDGGQS